MKRINVLQIGMSSLYGGTEAYLINQYRRLNRTQINYDFLDLKSHGREMCFTEEIEKYSKIFKVKVNRKDNPFLFYVSILKIMYEAVPRYDAIVYNINGLNLVFPIVAAKIFGHKNIIVHSHNSGEMDGKKSLLISAIRSVNKILLNFVADKRLACSSKAGEYLFNDKKFKIIKNGIDLNRYKYDKNRREKIRRKYNINNNFVIGHVGRFSYQKNQDYLVEIFKEVHEQKKNSKLLIVGDENSDKNLSKIVHEKIKKYGLENDVIFAGVNKNTEDFYSAMDCFVLPSRFEGLPLVGIEAQAEGLQCFFSDKISDELAITELANFISIEENPRAWSDAILSKKYDGREEAYFKLKKQGYDIDDQVKSIMQVFATVR